MRIADLRIASFRSGDANPHAKSDGFFELYLSATKNEKPFLLLVVGYPAENCRLPDISRKGLAGICSRIGRLDSICGVTHVLSD